MMSRRFTSWIVPGMFALIAPLLAVRAVNALTRSDGLLPGNILLGCLAAGFLYFVSHVLRAVRLAVIAMPMLGISFRTTCMLHFFVAPWSLFMPFKFDELIRLNELRRTGHSWSRSIITLLIDRSMDGVVLCGLSLLLLASGRPIAQGLIALLSAGLLTIAVVFFVLPVMLEALQRYIFMHHYRQSAVQFLKTVNNTRGLLVISKRAIGGAAPFLVLTTLGIWALEFAAIFSLVGLIDVSTSSPLDLVELTLQRADSSWRILLLGMPGSSTVHLLTVTFYGVLMLAWPWSMLVYRARQGVEPLRPRLPQANGLSIVSSFRQV